MGHWWQSAGSEGPHPGVMVVGCSFSFCCICPDPYGEKDQGSLEHGNKTMDPSEGL